MADVDSDVRREGAFIVPQLPIGTWNAGVDGDGNPETMAPLIFNA